MVRLPRRFPFAACGVLLAFALSRHCKLSATPIFCDEAVYMHRSLLGFHDSAHLFDSLKDGKRPSFIWLVVVMLNFVSDPLLAGRLVCPC